MKRALVLSGGGARGVFQVGVIVVMILEGKLDFQVFCGVSVGALNAGFLAQAPASEDGTRSLSNLAVYTDRLSRFWTGIKDQRELFRRRAGGFAGASVGKNSIYDATPLKRLLRDAIDPARLCSSGRCMIVGVTSMETGRYHPVRNDRAHEDRLLDYLIASAMTPVYFEPVEMAPPEAGAKPQHLVDGGLRNLAPIGDALAERPDEIYFLNTYAPQIPHRSYRDNLLGTAIGAFDFLDRSVDVVADELHRSVLDRVRRLDRLKETWEQFRRRLPAEVKTLMEFQELEDQFATIHRAPIHEIAPTTEFGSEHALDFSPPMIRAAYEHGRQRGREFLAARAGRVPDNGSRQQLRRLSAARPDDGTSQGWTAESRGEA